MSSKHVGMRRTHFYSINILHLMPIINPILRAVQLKSKHYNATGFFFVIHFSN